MKYSLLVTAPPESPGALSALAVARAVLVRGHTLYRVFFHQDGVRVASAESASALRDGWLELTTKKDIDLVVCISAAAQRGLISGEELDRGATDFANVAPGFVVSGLGQWADALLNSDRVLSF